MAKKKKSTKATKDKKETVFVFHIKDFDESLKQLVRENLTAICHGAAKAGRPRKTYSYRETLKEFLARYESKPKATRKGLIGELLAHIFIAKYREEVLPISPFFNLEERSIKKGFDIVLYEYNKKKIWITEIKSGEAGKKPAKEKNGSLLGLAKRDLITRFSDKKASIWHNAVNGATIALSDSDMKSAVIGKLEKILDTELADEESKEKNAILFSVLYKDLKDHILISDLEVIRENVKREKCFSDLMVFSVQKRTFQKVYEFLKDEADG